MLQVRVKLLASVKVAAGLGVYLVGIRGGDGFILEQDAVAVVGEVIVDGHTAYGSADQLPA
ncbi:MAG: hypothetical protein ACYSTF_10315, partial [Planctomycetota bacterium]